MVFYLHKFFPTVLPGNGQVVEVPEGMGQAQGRTERSILFLFSETLTILLTSRENIQWNNFNQKHNYYEVVIIMISLWITC